MSRATVDAVNTLPDHHRVLRLVIPGAGVPQRAVPYRRAPRAAGTTKYPLSRMMRLTVDSLTGFCVAPLRLATWFGLGGALVDGRAVRVRAHRLPVRTHRRRLDVDVRGSGRGRRRAAAVPRPAR